MQLNVRPGVYIDHLSVSDAKFEIKNLSVKFKFTVFLVTVSIRNFKLRLRYHTHTHTNHSIRIHEVSIFLNLLLPFGGSFWIKDVTVPAIGIECLWMWLGSFSTLV
jgi:hypothetical protein